MGGRLDRLPCPVPLRQCPSSRPGQQATCSRPTSCPLAPLSGPVPGSSRLSAACSPCPRLSQLSRRPPVSQSDSSFPPLPPQVIPRTISCAFIVDLSSILAASPGDIASLERALQQFLASGVAPNTRKTYLSGWHKYQSFTASYSFTLFPVSSEKVALFVAHLGQQGLAISTIEVYLAGLRYFNLLANPSEASPSLHTPFLKLHLRGIQRANVVKKPALVRLPITRGILAKIRTALAVNPLEYDSVLTWAAACTGFLASSALVSS